MCACGTSADGGGRNVSGTGVERKGFFFARFGRWLSDAGSRLFGGPAGVDGDRAGRADGRALGAFGWIGCASGSSGFLPNQRNNPSTRFFPRAFGWS
jgi:hypothetical protein